MTEKKAPKPAWLNLTDAAAVLGCSKSYVCGLGTAGHVRTRPKQKHKHHRQYSHRDILAHKAKYAHRVTPTKPRKYSAQQTAVRSRSNQPVLPDDIAHLVRDWNGSKEKRAYRKRFQLRNKKGGA